MLIEWQERWVLGEDRIDAEHLAMFGLINTLLEAVGRGADREEASDILRALVDHTRVHFAYEEGLMAATGYPAATHHREQHQKLLGIITLLAQNMELVNSEITLGAMGFFDDWFIIHVENDDSALGRFLAARQQDDAAS